MRKIVISLFLLLNMVGIAHAELTTQEKSDLWDYVLRIPFMTTKLIKVKMMEMDTKSDEEVRAILTADKQARIDNLLKQKANIETQLNKLGE